MAIKTDLSVRVVEPVPGSTAVERGYLPPIAPEGKYLLRLDQLMDDRNKPRSRSLFREFQHDDTTKYPYYFNLGEYDKADSISLKRLYIQMADLSEYTFANYVFQNYQFWQALCETAWFSPFITEWRSELRTKLASEALSKVRDKASKGDLNAMKYIHDLATDKPKRGRPQKNPVRSITPSEADLEADFERLTTDG